MKDHSIEVPHFYEMHYSKNGHLMKIEIDLRDTVPFLSRRAVSHWEPPFQDEFISDAEREKIIMDLESFLLAERKTPRVEVGD